MTPAAFRASLSRLSWSQAAAARILRRPYRTVQAWADAGPHHREPDASALLLIEEPSAGAIDEDTGEYLSEDYAFCKRWRKIGGKIRMET